ncbi:MAG: hypothetical protein AAF367_11790 [Pseudomonadota bacterium]
MADKTQRVMWTVLPNGFGESDQQLRLSVLVAPQLTLIAPVPEVLSEFPDFLDWPAVLEQADFKLEFEGNGVELTQVSKPVSEVWQAMFPPVTTVLSREFEDMTGMQVLSYPVAGVHDHIQGLYAKVAATGGQDRPTIDDLRRDLNQLADGVPRPREVLRIVAESGIKPLTKSLQGAYALHETFHTPLEQVVSQSYTKQGDTDPREDAIWTTAAQTPLPTPDTFAKTIDFHRIVSSMNQHPTLLRQLGLVIDFVADRNQFAPSGGADAMRFAVGWPASDESITGVETLDDLRPITRTILTDTEFDAAPSDTSSPVAGPVVRLNDDRFRLLQIDVDGSATKLRNLTRSLQTMSRDAMEEDEESREKTPNRAGLPALRSDGLTLIETGRGGRLSGAFQRSRQLFDADTANVDVELFAEDLVRGLHIDMFDDERGEWASLCRRDGDYQFINTGDTLQVEDEEGMVRIGATTSSDGENPNIVKLHENTVSWTGWSLTTPPVGRGLDTDDQPRDLANTATMGLPLESAFSVRAGSLPSLRFGRDYRMRARVVDLAHNALAFDRGDITPDFATNRETYKRFEPLESPALALVEGGVGIETPDAGESMARIAIRTFNETPDLNIVPTDQIARRHILAPRVTGQFAETHGVLDVNGRIDPATFSLLADRDDVLPRIVLTAPDSGVSVANPDDDPANRSKPRYAYAPEGFELPHLPDPMARGVTVRVQGIGLAPSDEELSIPYYPATSWPDALPFEIVVSEGPAGAAFDATGRQLQLTMPKAEIARVKLSHNLTAEDLERLGIWDWARAAVGPNLTDDFIADAVAGRHWMLTPDRRLRVYHAVQKPLVTPDFLTLSIARSAGGTVAGVTGLSPIHAKSTDKLDLCGTWIDVKDRRAAPAPVVRDAMGDAKDMRIRRLDWPNGQVRYRFNHEFGDTRYRRVSYEMTATTRFREFMPEAVRADRDALSVTSEPRVGWVPNATPPPAPEVLYVVPTFGWSRHTDSDGRYRAFRDGGGIRVYLNRPWMSSGAAEMLAVVVTPPNASVQDVEGRLKPFVTQWGTDPVWVTSRIQTPAPARSAFPLRRDAGPLPSGTLAPTILPDSENDLPAGPFTVNNLQSPDMANLNRTVSAIPHAVGWDDDRKLWYADIVVDPGASYNPFIRLALARYQPVSVPGAHLSNIVLADFVQLTPDRLVTVTPRGSGRYEVALFGSAYTGSGGSPGRGTSAEPEFDLEVQEPTGDAADELGWRAASGAQIDVDDSDGGPGRFGLAANTLSTADTAMFAGPVTLARRLSTTDTPLDDSALAEAQAMLAARDFAGLIDRLDLMVTLSPPELWRATVTLPDAPAQSRFRLLISEYERWRVDTRTTDARSPGDADPGQRLVFAEAVELTSQSGTLPIAGG